MQQTLQQNTTKQIITVEFDKEVSVNTLKSINGVEDAILIEGKTWKIISDLEKEPAYKRRNVRLENVPNSADSSVSRLTLSVDDTERKPEIRANNSFLHDRVD